MVKWLELEISYLVMIVLVIQAISNVTLINFMKFCLFYYKFNIFKKYFGFYLHCRPILNERLSGKNVELNSCGE